MHNMFRAIRRIVDEHNDVKVIYPIHLNPLVRSVANEVFDGCDKVKLIEPLEVFDFHNFQNKSYIYTYIFTLKTPEKHENIGLICKNTDTSDTLGTS